MTTEKFQDVRMVLEDRVVTGTLSIEDDTIVAVDIVDDITDAALEGDYLLPGLVELHTDHLEGHYAPRPGVRWNAVASIQAHDAQVAGSGITTVFDALRVGMDEDARITATDMRVLADAIVEAREADRLRADHFIHLRCEVSSEDVVNGFALFRDEPLLRIASLMDHTPGQRQFVSLDKYKEYYQGKTGMSDAEFNTFVAHRTGLADKYSPQNRQKIAEECRRKGVILASHDDATTDHVDEALEHDVQIAEFPTTLEAARASHDAGLKVLMGAPNLVRGGSHSGNVSAQALAENGVLDVLSSDYIPFSLLHAAFLLTERVDTIRLPDAVNMVSKTPAEAAGLDDRGILEAGKRADFLQATYDPVSGVPVVRGVWREGRRVA
ncbi:MAG: alpha-D-ribose 1-methylphosphonate 5-triphosphate diphosphatase [Pseudomonadota bacterium]